MAARPKKPSPTLGAATAMIGAASGALVPAGGGFNHSFEVPLDRVRPDPNQARRRFDTDAIAALAATLRSEGQLQPVLLRPDPAAGGRWILVAGERRWRAAQLLGWPVLLAIVHDGDPEVASLLENLQRVDLDPIEEARGIARLIDGKGWSQEQAARALGRTKSDVSGVLNILALPEAVLEKVQTSELSVAKSLLIELSRVRDPQVLAGLVDQMRRGRLTVRAVRAALAQAPADAPAAAGARGRDALDAALVAVRRAVADGAAVTEAQAATLRALRETIDAALARRSWG